MNHSKDYIIKKSVEHNNKLSNLLFEISQPKTIKTNVGFRKVNYFKKLNAEELLQSFVIFYLRLKGLDTIIHSFSEGKRNPYQIFLSKCMGLTKGVPDIIVLHKNSRFNGLVLELKAFNPFKKNNELKASITVEQQKFISTFAELGFDSHFASVENVFQIIDNFANIS